MNETIILIIAGLLAAIIVIVLMINFIVKRRKEKKKEAEVMPKLDAWIKKAKEMNYNYTKIRTLLEINEWDKKLIKKALKNNGLEKPEGYVE